MADKPVVDRFLFNVSAGEQSRKDLGWKIEALEERIDNIIKKAELNGVPLITHILAIGRDPKELERLGKALVRIAELVPDLDELKRRQSILELAITDPGWFAATFGDFDQEIDSLNIDDLK